MERAEISLGNREVLQSEIRMQIFVKLGLRTHESSDGPANRRVVLQTESFCSIGLLIMAMAAGECEVLTGLSGNLAS